jgi:bisphosphoglycerate-independent phosphoglycerate mutase (AlkP superfamily)
VKAHGTAVGLPSDDDMGNSEVGHNALGAGRIFAQGYVSFFFSGNMVITNALFGYSNGSWVITNFIFGYKPNRNK